MSNTPYRTPAELGITSENILAIPDMKFYGVRSTPEFRIYGIMYSKDGYFCRIPEDVAEKCNGTISF